MSEEHEAETDEPEEKVDRTIVTGQSSGGENIKDDCSELTDNNLDNDEASPRSFPRKLMDILSNEELHDVISWLPHGYGFIIHKKKVFASDILPHHFKASKFTSFTRKLNRWGFNRAARGPETGAYYHKLFVRDKPELVFQMTSNSGNKYSSAPQTQHLLPSVPMMSPGPMPPGGGVPMPFYMQPPPQMAMLSPQQQQSMWQQQMQMFQFQQMQMMRFQQHHGGGALPPGMPPMMMPMPPHMQPMHPGDEDQGHDPNQQEESPSNGPAGVDESTDNHDISADDPLVAMGEDGTTNDLSPEEDNAALHDLGNNSVIEC